MTLGKLVLGSLVFSAGLLIHPGCGQPPPPTTTMETLPEDAPAARRLFLQKASRMLRPGAPALSSSDVDQLLERNNTEIVRQMLDDRHSREAVLQISASILGLPVDQLRDGDKWLEKPFEFFPAVAAAGLHTEGKDALPLLASLKTPRVRGVGSDIPDFFIERFFEALDLAPYPRGHARRTAIYQAMLGGIETQRSLIAQLQDPMGRDAFCAATDYAYTFGFNFVTFMEMPESIRNQTMPNELADGIGEPFSKVCGFAPPFDPVPARADALAAIERQRAGVVAAFTRVDAMLTEWENDRDSPFKTFTWAELQMDKEVGLEDARGEAFYPAFWFGAPNTSTNYNRKRAAYVLDRFFCDDLKPVGAALPESHGEGQHASDPACQACHFKLDPMAGFFRTRGIQGYVYDNELIFDDQVKVKLTDYEQAWKATDLTHRRFDIGYIRSTRDESLNAYGDTLADLDAIIKSAPEVERCFARRIFEYFNGKDQAVDPGFIADVAAEMRANKGTDGFRRGVTRVVTGRTFRMPQRNDNVCYDLAPGIDPTRRPPCEVAAILESHCVSCHTGTASQGGLDLKSWVPDPEAGGAFRFPHLGPTGVAVPRAESFERVISRLVTSELTRQMPQGLDMPLRSREALVLWLRSKLEAGGKD